MKSKKLKKIFDHYSDYNALFCDDDAFDEFDIAYSEDERRMFVSLEDGKLILTEGVLFMDEQDFIDAYNAVKGIVGKLSRDYYLKLWSKDDWQQEAQIVLFKLLQKNPSLIEDYDKLRGFFKIRFGSYVKDNLRKQAAQKRLFDKMIYEEIFELGHQISDNKMDTADYLALKDKLKELKLKLDKEDFNKLMLLMTGVSFKGKNSFIRDIKIEFDDFED